MSPPMLSRDEVEARIAEGDVLVIHRGFVLKLNSWVERHPGGWKAIQHEIGRDATDEMDVYHAKETIKLMEIYRVGRIAQPWDNFVPPIQGGVFRSRAELGLPERSKEDCKVEDKPETGSGRFREWKRFTAKDYNAELPDKEADKIEEFVNEELQFDLEKYPDITPAVQGKIRTRFRELQAELERDGFFVCNYWDYARELVRITTLYTISICFFIYRENSTLNLCLSAFFLGLAWHQLIFIAHDAGHLGITHNYYVDNIFGVIIADFFGGLSLGWWKNNHNVHHIVTNDPVHDPDIQHLPFFAVTSRLFGNVYSTYYEKVLWYDAFAKVLIRIQNYLYYPLLALGRFNLYRLSWEYLIKGDGPRKGKAAFLRWLELSCLAVFNYYFFYLICYKLLHTGRERFIFIMISHVVTCPVHVQITLSHFAQSTSNLGANESFAQHQVRSSMDVDCPVWLDFFHGGLQFQTIHHLFPRMPRHNFRAVQPIVKAFCEEFGLHYTIFTFAKGNQQIIGRLAEVANQAKVFNACSELCRQELTGSNDTPNLDKARKKVRLEKSLDMPLKATASTTSMCT